MFQLLVAHQAVAMVARRAVAMVARPAVAMVARPAVATVAAHHTVIVSHPQGVRAIGSAPHAAPTTSRLATSASSAARPNVRRVYIALFLARSIF